MLISFLFLFCFVFVCFVLFVLFCFVFFNKDHISLELNDTEFEFLKNGFINEDIDPKLSFFLNHFLHPPNDPPNDSRNF